MTEKYEWQSLRSSPGVSAESERGGGFPCSSLPQITLSLDRKVEAANQALCRLLGYREGEMVGTSVLSMVHPEDMEALVVKLEALVRGISLGFNRPYRLFHKDGHTLRIEATLSVLRDRSGYPSSIVVIVVGATIARYSCATAMHPLRSVRELVSA
jgi:PAS domain S-box-containing protein